MGAGLQRASAAARGSRTGCFATKPDDPIGWCGGHGCEVTRCPDVEIRIFSLLQPWASLWVAGPPIGKGNETRSFGTSYRGLVAVHASRGFDREIEIICQVEPFASALREIGFERASDLPRGAVVGRVTVVDCLEMVDKSTFEDPRSVGLMAIDRVAEPERSFGHYEPGRRAWMTGPERVRLPEPIPFKGGLGLRHCPGEIAARLLP